MQLAPEPSVPDRRPCTPGRDLADGFCYAPAYRRLTHRRRTLIALLALAAVMSVLVDLATGPSGLGLAEVIRGLVEPGALTMPMQVILWDIRLPTALMAVAVGAGLALSGAEMQTVLNNPLASPYTLGISSAAILGATLSIVLDLNLAGLGPVLTVPVAAFVFAALASLLILGLSVRYGSTTETIVLFGIACCSPAPPWSRCCSSSPMPSTSSRPCCGAWGR